MALVSLRQVLDHAAEHGYGVPAFNVNNLEQVQAIMEAAQATDSPVICKPRPGHANTRGKPICVTWCWPPSRPTPTLRWYCTKIMAPRQRNASNRSVLGFPA